MLVYRDGRRAYATRALLAALGDAVERQVRSAGGAPNSQSNESSLAALLRAGELECALADAAAPAAAIAARLTGALAEHLLTSPISPTVLAERLRLLEGAPLPATVHVSAPEGFAYYALHPLAYATAMRNGRCGRGRPARAQSLEHDAFVIVGIRSIGTTLSAVAAAAARAAGAHAERFTVRPAGHPFARHTQFSDEQRATIAWRRSGATFVVVDEGPGLSGSSLLSVAEALEREGVAQDAIVLLSGHAPDLARLCAPEAAARWRRYRALAAGHATHLPSDATAGGALDLSAGRWRSIVYGENEVVAPASRRHSFTSEEMPAGRRRYSWPAAWTSVERTKFLTRDRRTLLKFEGLGQYGEAVRERSAIVAAAGFGPRVHPAEHGFAAYEWLASWNMVDPGRPRAGSLFARGDDSAGPAEGGRGPTSTSRLESKTLERLADYCAFRAAEFRAPLSEAETSLPALREMFALNTSELLGIHAPEVPAEIAIPVITDARMQPHEWITTRSGHLLKCDAAAHGDDHFFPGPCDIAWDLAGAIVEWEMPPDAAEAFLRAYERRSGDYACARLPFWMAAYVAFRAGYCTMAAQAMAGTSDAARLARDAERYRHALQRQISASAAA